MLSGTMNGQRIDTHHPQITVAAGDTITGQFSIEVRNSGWSSHIFPIIWLPTWGDRTTNFTTIGSQENGTRNYSINLNLTAPQTPGTYYIILAASWELTGANVASCTNGPVGGDKWNDGNDVVDWTPPMLESAMANGRVVGALKLYTYGYAPMAIPATALRVSVLPAA